MVWARSPPVPTMSIAPRRRCRASTRSDASSMASTMPTSSSTVSPFIRRATMKAAIWAGLAAPSRISAIVARLTARSSDPPSIRVPSTTGHPPCSAKPRSAMRGEPTPTALGGPPALPEDAAALLLGGAAPHALLLPDLQGELEAGLLHQRTPRRRPWRRRRRRRAAGKKISGSSPRHAAWRRQARSMVRGALRGSEGQVERSLCPPGRPDASPWRDRSSGQRRRCRRRAAPRPRRPGSGGGPPGSARTGSGRAGPSRSRPAPTPGTAAPPRGCAAADRGGRRPLPTPSRASTRAWRSAIVSTARVWTRCRDASRGRLDPFAPKVRESPPPPVSRRSPRR